MTYQNVIKGLAQLLIVLISSTIVISCEQPPPTMQKGTPAPAFTLKQLNGVMVNFPEQYQGHVVALRFWADWCPYCHDEMKMLQPIYHQYQNQGLVILAANVMQSPETVRAFVKQLDISYNILLDQQGEVMRQYQVMGLPATYIIDRKGIIQIRIIGESTADTFEQLIRELL